ncbi:hypothetical protein A0J57_17160 [Sphingobium sp. 22B]|nr:hypothetical protein AXW74_12570 [Sphingobium sp. AM]KYC31171.1 hypothetical protein A0J57_17160 [Sphingobium sp. 22B]OAP31172.1 hypothetical protein A8O16_15065 [Sphingobium sp. 20006FA]
MDDDREAAVHGLDLLDQLSTRRRQGRGRVKALRQRFKRYPIGYFHMDIAEVRTAGGKLYLFVAIDRTSKSAVTQLVDKADRRTVSSIASPSRTIHGLTQVERMNRTIKDATVKRFHYGSHEQLRAHLADFIDAYISVAGSRPSATSHPTNTSPKSRLHSPIES